MQSPFPGMDPYIEACGLWPDFHGHLIEKIYDSIASALPARYLVQTGERSYIVLVGEEGKENISFLPAVGITGPQPGSVGPSTAVAEPSQDLEAVTLRAFIDERFRERFVEIYEANSERRLVTCIEVLSPSNKRRGSEGWEQYRRKRQALMLGTANLVEIDLLRGGSKLPMLDPWPDSPYTLLVSRQSRSPYCRVWKGDYKKPLPVIPVPLDCDDPDLSLNLQAMIEAIYLRGRYHRRIDYTKPLVPALDAKEQTWVTALLGTLPTA